MARKLDTDCAEYLASLCKELAVLAQSNGFDTGSYLLTMASLEFSKQEEEAEKRVNAGLA